MTYDEWLFKVFNGEAFPTMAQDRLARMAWDAATELEREVCAKVCDGAAWGCAAEIRARSNAKHEGRAMKPRVPLDAPVGREE